MGGRDGCFGVSAAALDAVVASAEVCGSTGPTPATHADAQAPTTVLQPSDRGATRTAPSCLDRDALTYRDLQAARRAAGVCGQRERVAVVAYEKACAAWVIGRGTLAEVEEAERALDALRVECAECRLRLPTSRRGFPTAIDLAVLPPRSSVPPGKHSPCPPGWGGRSPAVSGQERRSSPYRTQVRAFAEAALVQCLGFSW